MLAVLVTPTPSVELNVGSRDIASSKNFACPTDVEGKMSQRIVPLSTPLPVARAPAYTSFT